jgi:beta-lactamase regulating signal transducer with metallopeptidase domain
MNTLLDLLQQPLARRLGWTLLHFLWQGALLAVAYAAVRGLVHRRSANTRYLAGCLTLLLMAAAPVMTFHALDAKPAIHHAAPVATAPAPTLPTMAPAGNTRLSFDGWSKFAGWLNKVTEATLPWFVGAWAVGVFALSLRLGVGWFQVRRLRRRSVEPLDAWLADRLAELQRRLRVSRPVRLVKSALVEVPTVIGWLRPVILLPTSTLSGLSPLQLELILAHELAHLRRGDYWVNLFQILLETLLFYHPAVWWVSRCVREDREHCCDDLAVAVCGNRLAYAQALTALEELRQLPANVALAASGGSLMARVKHILGLPTETAPSAWRRVAGGALIALGLLAIVVSVVMMLTPNRYCSTVVISVRKEAQSANAPRADFDPYFIATEAERIQSKVVLYPVIESFGLRKKWAARSNQGEELSEQEAFNLLLHNLKVRQSRNTKLMEISVFDEDRDEAAKLANAIAESFRNMRNQDRQAMSQLGVAVLRTNLDQQTLVVSNLQQKVQTMEHSLNIPVGVSGADLWARDNKRNDTLTEALQQAQGELAFIENRIIQ